ncbi:CatA-like O-acetyltransferase [Ruminococcus sp. Marseille-P6503]|uniref:CatA-like O-acetyltransferase n=1 Tax=Ruminococcus sp. Marseille-P6503 TaxID=2364796 RepID=UPI000F52B41F|nr:CatA-like O-acetyltransferase [Ruminococcus sp. Marseille-P6503]
MNGGYKIIDESGLDRKLHCRIFRNSAQPCYCITSDIDVTELYSYVKAKGCSFTLAFIYAVMKCANELENFRYRFLDGNIVLYDKCGTEFTYLKDGDELFYYICAPYAESMEEYINNAERIIAEQKTYFDSLPANDAFQFSPMPWFSYTSVSHTFSGDNTKANPMFDWGRFYEKNGRKLMPFSVQVHHSFADGIHVARLYQKLQEYMDSLGNNG